MRDLLQVAARSGSGSAARALGSGLAGMRTATRRVLIFGGIVALFLYLGWDVFSGIGGNSPALEAQNPPVPQEILASRPPDPTPTMSVQPFDASHPERVTYAIDVNDIAGLAPSIPSGTLVDIWVTWERPITKTPGLQRLVRGVLIEQIAPPVTPEGPYVAVLSVDERKVENLLWGDRYGALSATIMPVS